MVQTLIETSTFGPEAGSGEQPRSEDRFISNFPLLSLFLKLIAWVFASICVVAAPLLIYAGAIQLVGNIDTVEPGKVYRSATLSADALTTLIRDKHIRTVINLRGANPNQSWYQDDVRVTASEHVRLIDLAMSAIHEPGPELLATLSDTLKSSEEPILIHCSSGSDRTGLASAMYELQVMGKPASVARRQLSFYWGHFPWLGSPTIAMDRAFDKVVAASTDK